MSFRGMDVDEVDRLAARLDLQARAVASIVATVDGAVAGLAGVWTGEDLESFRAVWQQTHRPHATAVGDQLAGWVNELRQQVAQQRATSDEARASGGLSLAAVAGGVATWGTWLVSAAHKFSADKWSVGAYPRRYEKFLKSLASHKVIDGFFRYKRSPIFHFLNDNKRILRWADNKLGVAGVLANSSMAVTDLHDHHYLDAAFDVSNAVGAKAPLWSAAANSWLEAIDASRGVDWSAHGFEEVWQVWTSDPRGTWDYVWQAETHEMPGRLLRVFGLGGD